MKILVVGANGQLGSEIKELAKSLTSWKFLFTDVEELDATDYAALKEFCELNKPSFIINCAAYTAVDIAENDIETAKLINVSVPKYLGKISKEINAKIIHISTDYVFDGTAYEPYVEDDLVGPNSVYGKTKLNGEIALIKENPKSIIIRTSWLYSSFGKNFLKTMLKLGENRDSISVISDQVGTPTYARDLARTILKIIEKSEDNWKSGIFHYSNEGVCSWYDFAKQIFEITKIDCKVVPIGTASYPTPAKRPAYSVLCKDKIKKVYKLEIPYWRDSLKSCLKTIQTK